MKTLKLIGFAYLLLLFSSCESLLHEEIYGKQPEDSFVTESNALEAITGVYAWFQSYNYFAQYYWLMSEASSGEFTKPPYGSEGDFTALLTHRQTETNAVVQQVWESLYMQIARTNVVLENVPGMSIKDEVKNSVIGEAKFVRAMDYFNLVRFWGAVPLRLTSIPAYGDVGERRSESDVYGLIISDLTDAVNLLPTTQALKGRATKGAAYALLAKVYLTGASMKKYSESTNYDFVNVDDYYAKALDNCNKVIALGQYSLVNDFAKQFPIYFDIDGKYITPESNSSESVFEIQFDRSYKYSSQMPMMLTPYASLPLVKDPTTGKWISDQTKTPVRGGGYSYNDTGWGTFRVTQTAFNDFFKAHADSINGELESDYRIDVTFLGGHTGYVKSFSKKAYLASDTLFTYPLPKEQRPAADIQQNWPYMAKMQDPDGIASNQHATNWVFLRYADVLLMRAEVLNELGQTDAAISDVNRLMERARKANGIPRLLPLDYSMGLTKDSARTMILKERQFELMGEGHLWFDLVRTGRYVKYIQRYYDEEYLMDKINNLDVAIDKRNLLFPIPNRERVVNSYITIPQNPGY